MSGAILTGQPVNWSHPLNRGLVSWWLALPGGWGRGMQFRDLCGKNHGTLTNGPAWSSAMGRPGGWGSLKFDGSDDYVQVAAHASLNSSVGTIAFWIKLLAVPGTPSHVMGNCAAYGWSGWQVYMDGVNIACSLSTSGGVKTYLGYNDISDGKWHHVAYTYASGGLSTAYFDGLFYNEDAATVSFTLANAIRICATIDDYFINTNAHIDDLRIGDRKLTASEVKSYYDLSKQWYGPLLNRVTRRGLRGGSRQQQLTMMGMGA